MFEAKPEPAPKIRVLLVDDHAIVRVGLRTVLGEEPDMEVVGEAHDGPSALAAFDALSPDVTLMDLRLPGGDGVALITEMRRRAPEAKILVFTSYDTDEDIFRAVKAGARGYLLKGTVPDGVLEQAIRTVYAGGRHLPAEIGLRLADRMAAPSLTAREIAVLELVARGLSNEEIGVALSVSAGTVKTHLKRIFPKLGVADRTAAALTAVQRGILK